MIGRIDAEAAARSDAGFEEEDQLVVIVTDGLENASREHDRSSIFSMITERRQRGWSFLFLGADQDSYAAGGEMAVAAANTANWDKTAEGTAKMWQNVSHSATLYQERARQEPAPPGRRHLPGGPRSRVNSQFGTTCVGVAISDGPGAAPPGGGSATRRLEREGD